jgi:hypothetical protein
MLGIDVSFSGQFSLCLLLRVGWMEERWAVSGQGGGILEDTGFGGKGGGNIEDAPRNSFSTIGVLHTHTELSTSCWIEYQHLLSQKIACCHHAPATPSVSP